LVRSDERLRVAEEIAQRYAALPEVEAVALAGSLSINSSDEISDIDLYVYSGREPPMDDRARIALTSSVKPELGNTFFEPGEEWIDASSSLPVDVMFRRMDWIEEQLERVLVRCEASMGYSTCFWYNIRNSQPLFDRTGWFAGLRRRARESYPVELQRSIIAKNFPFLHRSQSCYLHQIDVACRRGDLVSVNHRAAAFLASYFDVLFALNAQLHPGEKRLVFLAEKLCDKRPSHIREDVEALICAACTPEADVVKAAAKLADELEQLLIREHMLPIWN
jgi:predicted nucleotidyltransferase